jgi:hypothetical protein
VRVLFFPDILYVENVAYQARTRLVVGWLLARWFIWTISMYYQGKLWVNSQVKTFAGQGWLYEIKLLLS